MLSSMFTNVLKGVSIKSSFLTVTLCSFVIAKKEKICNYGIQRQCWGRKVHEVEVLNPVACILYA